MVVRSCLLGGMLLFATLGACKSNEKKGNDTEGAAVAAEHDKIADSEDALLSKRDALFNMRQDLASKRKALVEERAVIHESGGDTSEIDERAQELLTQEEELVGQELALNQAMKEIDNQRRELMAALSAGVSGNDIAGREAGMAGREKNIARREAEVADREAALAKREEELASKWKDSCESTPQTIIRTVDVKGSSYTKQDVEPLLAKARKDMSKKGLLASDLPEQARDLESEANDGIKSGDYGRARLAATQLVATIRSTTIDKNFIAAKIKRLNGRMKGKSLDAQTEQLFRDATALYGDASFSKANSKLNQIYATLK